MEIPPGFFLAAFVRKRPAQDNGTIIDAFRETHMSNKQGRITDICDRLLEAFAKAVPLHPEGGKGRRQPSQKEIALVTEAGLKKFYEAARAEREQHRLGVIGRARVAFALQQRLLATGYPAPVVKQVLFAMLVAAFVGGKER